MIPAVPSDYLNIKYSLMSKESNWKWFFYEPMDVFLPGFIMVKPKLRKYYPFSEFT